MKKFLTRLFVLSLIVITFTGCGGGGDSPSSTPAAAPAATTTQMGGARQGIALSLTTAVTTYVGAASVPGSTDATGILARFFYPSGITTDGTSLYVADRNSHTIRKIVISTGVATTLVGSALTSGTADGTGAVARFNTPRGITTDGTSLYVADTNNHTIRRIQ